MKVRSIGLLLAALLVVLGSGVALAGVADLGGTSWRVVAYNVGKYNTLTPVEGDHEVMVTFGKNGRVSGAGINGFTAHYSATRSRNGRNAIAISNVSLGHRSAYRTAAERGQERNIVHALNGAVAYRMAGGQLDLLYRNGRIAATLLTTDEAKVEVRRENILDHANLAVPYDKEHVQGAHIQGVSSTAVATTYRVYRNGYKEATVRPDGPDAILLTLDGEVFRLHRLHDQSGVRFIEREDRTAELWESDGKTTIVIRGNMHPDFVPVY